MPSASDLFIDDLNCCTDVKRNTGTGFLQAQLSTIPMLSLETRHPQSPSTVNAFRSLHSLIRGSDFNQSVGTTS